MEKETDFRGFVVDKGWAHSVAHGSDLLAQIVCHSKSTHNMGLRALDVLGNIILKDTEVFFAMEENRMSFVVYHLLKHQKVTDTEIIAWIESLNKQISCNNSDDSVEYELFLKRRAKFNHFIRSVYLNVYDCGEIDSTSENRLILKDIISAGYYS